MAFFSPPSTGGAGTPGAPGQVRNTGSQYPPNPQNPQTRQHQVGAYKQALRGTYGPDGTQSLIGVQAPDWMSADRAAAIQGRINNRMTAGAPAAQPGVPGASTGQDQVTMAAAPGQPQPPQGTRQDQFNAWRDQLRGLNNSGIEAGAMPPSWLGDARAQRVQNRIMGRPAQKAGQPGGQMPVGVPY